MWQPGWRTDRQEQGEELQQPWVSCDGHRALHCDPPACGCSRIPHSSHLAALSQGCQDKHVVLAAIPARGCEAVTHSGCPQTGPAGLGAPPALT